MSGDMWKGVVGTVNTSPSVYEHAGNQSLKLIIKNFLMYLTFDCLLDYQPNIRLIFKL